MGLARFRRPLATDGAALVVPSGFVYPGNTGFFASGNDSTDSVRLVWNKLRAAAGGNADLVVPPLSEGFTATWLCKPAAMQPSYSIGFFHAPDLPTWEAQVGDPDDASGWLGAGCHPYPVPSDEVSPVTHNSWEISHNWIDLVDYSTGAEAIISEYGRIYRQVFRASVEVGGIRYEYWTDYEEDPTLVIDSLANGGSYDTRPECSDDVRAIQQGGPSWALGRETYNGLVTLPDMYGRRLTDSEIESMIANPYHSSIVDDLFYTKRRTTGPTDLEDESGHGNTPVFVLGSSASLPATADAV